ncbi:MAG: hypothetical protein K6T75_06700 [Acetobacteraceae bacterium]|nr:hypothetical protein [Acetobacteraceae bacterium]
MGGAGLTAESSAQRARQRLAAALRGGRASHAYLIVGGGEGEGAGLARELARAMLCLDARGGWACGACPSCRQVEGGFHPALRWLAPEGAYVRTDAVGKALAELWLRPRGGGRRVLVVEQADRLTPAAAGRLLKTLEDPPVHAVLVLAASDLTSLAPTVVSRCQVLKLGAGGGAGSGRAAAMGPAAAQVLERLGSGPPGAFLALAQEVLESPLRQPEALAALIERLQGAFRDALVLALAGEAVPLLYPDAKETALRLARTWPLARLWDASQALLLAQEALARNANRRLCVEALFLRLRG